jgi:hypothetical protein
MREEHSMRCLVRAIVATTGLFVCLSSSLSAASAVPQDPVTTQERIVITVVAESPRPKPLPYLYASYCGLQVGDVLTTTLALRNGAIEANPMMREDASSPFRFSLIKASSTLATIMGTEKLWKSGRRKTAVVTMLASNCLTAWVVSHNLTLRKGGR